MLTVLFVEVEDLDVLFWCSLFCLLGIMCMMKDCNSTGFVVQVFVASRLNVPGAWQMPQVILKFPLFSFSLLHFGNLFYYSNI